MKFIVKIKKTKKKKSSKKYPLTECFLVISSPAVEKDTHFESKTHKPKLTLFRSNIVLSISRKN